MSDKLMSRSGPIDPHAWDGQPAEPNRTPAAEAQAQRDIAEIIARGKAVQAQLGKQHPAPTPVQQDAGFEEAKHPRGQPGNAGEFGPGGGSAKTSGPPRPQSEMHTQLRAHPDFVDDDYLLKEQMKTLGFEHISSLPHTSQWAVQHDNFLGVLDRKSQDWHADVGPDKKRVTGKGFQSFADAAEASRRS